MNHINPHAVLERELADQAERRWQTTRDQARRKLRIEYGESVEILTSPGLGEGRFGDGDTEFSPASSPPPSSSSDVPATHESEKGRS